MSSLVTQMIIAEKYGPRLSVEQLASVMGLSKGAVYNQVSAGTFPGPEQTVRMDDATFNEVLGRGAEDRSADMSLGGGIPLDRDL